MRDVAFNEWTEQACPAQPPHPPGWMEWWNEHRTHVQETIQASRYQMGQQIEYAVLKKLERLGKLNHPLAKEILAVIENRYEREMETE